jgi:4-amino-4-deoxy-L-arabinose transferase-like glycosyltransferase
MVKESIVDGQPSGTTPEATPGWQAPALFATLIVWLSVLACWRPLANPDEGRYTDVARWMLRSGDWLIPRLNGLPFLHKPPLYYWIEASVMSLGGPSLLAARTASLLGGVMVCASAYVLARRWADARTANWSVLLLATNPLLVLGAQYANLDMLVAGCICVTITLAALAAWTPGMPGRALWWAAYGMAGVGVLAKGLIGIVLPGAVFVAWMLMMREWRRLWQAFSLVGLIVLAAVTLPWFVLGEQRVPGLQHFVIMVQHFQRYTQTGFNNAWGPWFFPVIVLIGLLPWSLCLWPMGKAVKAALKGSPGPRSLMWLALCWLLVILVFFSLPKSKLVGYILPVLAGCAMLMAPWVARWRHRQAMAGLGATLCVVLVAVAAHKQPVSADRLAQALRSQIAAGDVVVMWDRYDYAVPVALDRRQAMWVVSDWSTPGQQMPDNWRRELKEGLEFEQPAPGQSPLMSPSEWQERMSEVPGAWIWVDADTYVREPMLRHWPVAARDGKLVVLRVNVQAPLASALRADRPGAYLKAQ